MTDHRIATRKEWLAARAELLDREKAHTRLGDELARQRRALPWLRVEKAYRLDTDEGTRTLAELFDGRSQLLIYHFMFGPSYQAGCPVNSSIADSFDSVIPHLKARDVTFGRHEVACRLPVPQRRWNQCNEIRCRTVDHNRPFEG